MSKRCCICGKVITNSYDLCNRCLVDYGSNSAEWPEWLTFLVADKKRELNRRTVISRHEVSFSDLGLDIADGPEIGAH